MYRRFLAGVKAGLPASISLIPLGISMGLISAQAGLNWLQTGLLSALVMSGSAQIMAMGMLMEAVPLYFILMSSFFITLKNLMFSGTAMQRLGRIPLMRRLLCCFSICDTGATIFCLSEDNSEQFLLGINWILIISIAISSVAGALMTSALPDSLSNSFRIANYALFIFLIMPGIMKNKRLALLVGFTAVLNWLLRLVFSGSLALVVSMIAGAFIGVFFVDLDTEKNQNNKSQEAFNMTKILFVCHGNICRSPMAEFVMKDMVRRAGLEDSFEISSAATSAEELGSPVYPPARSKLREHDIDCSGKTARRIIKDDYDKFDLIIGMDSANMRNMSRVFGEDSKAKLHMLLDYAGRSGESVADPWYTGDFEATWQDVFSGCMGLLDQLCEEIVLDFSLCRERQELYALMAERMLWQKDYGRNLDALYDILTGLPHLGRRFVITLPEEDSPCRNYAERILAVFEEAKVPVRLG